MIEPDDVLAIKWTTRRTVDGDITWWDGADWVKSARNPARYSAGVAAHMCSLAQSITTHDNTKYEMIQSEKINTIGLKEQGNAPDAGSKLEQKLDRCVTNLFEHFLAEAKKLQKQIDKLREKSNETVK